MSRAKANRIWYTVVEEGPILDRKGVRLARYERGEIVSDDGCWRWVGGTIFDLSLEQWEPVPGRHDGRQRKPGRLETRAAARLALQDSDEWKRLEELKTFAQEQANRLKGGGDEAGGELAPS